MDENTKHTVWSMELLKNYFVKDEEVDVIDCVMNLENIGYNTYVSVVFHIAHLAMTFRISNSSSF